MARHVIGNVHPMGSDRPVSNRSPVACLSSRTDRTCSPHYPSMDPDQHIAYISDVGAYGLKPLFISGSVVTTIFLDLAFVSERWLRHTGRLAQNTTKAEKILSGFSIVFAIAGSAGLILLSIFDTYHHPVSTMGSSCSSLPDTSLAPYSAARNTSDSESTTETTGSFESHSG